MLDKNKLSKYLWCICKLSYFECYHQKTNYANILIKLAFLAMHLNDNEIDEIQGFLPKYKILQEFLRHFILLSNLFKNSKVSVQNLMKINKSKISKATCQECFYKIYETKYQLKRFYAM